MTFRRPLLFTVFLIFTLLPQLVAGTILPRNKITNGGYILYKNGNIVEQFRASELFVPASTIKLLTAYSALKTLGPEFRFTTSFYLDANHVLYIRGGGDPVLTTESLTSAAQELKRRGITKVSGYVLDDSLFALEQPLPDGSENSANPYDVANSGLAVNFNSIAVAKAKDGTITSGEKHTPLTVLGREIGQQLKPGKHRVNINAFEVRSSTPLPLRYSAELLHELLVQEGIKAEAVIRPGKVPTNAKLIYDHLSSQSLVEIVRSCLYVSNNFIANQLALTAGAQHFGAPATWEKARQLLTHFATNRIGISKKELQVVEGSGLSRQTRITPIAMLKILRAFEPYRELLPEKYGAQLKSGTMSNVFCYAGYLDAPEGNVLFVLMLNQPENTRKMLLSSLEKQFNPVGVVTPATAKISKK
ncbi:D-alanyl-D-alanine carboxypeptidase/D-alanyl-D-alanine-endopeptidase [Desulfopila aestuarii]|uniref:D-alanyl-D-alanine carboxypeptidase / D-alanyl-D-alanine-endopeptidase (Penicillin-binding protein 4) n=1 Tax=Desulfopila aestuarii DSM 18488 TaxID=1121416 RepID=A0A1M7YEJ8_9BACT|nr:D-alanyl-D-alanine carboxypeptidase [Desulfopila aestuarii]SHO51062.1 D-alanyl-D-alanine carboxypeptidase / D-alanyl-D-alanine-endopeptidase (penicillin-binding protein 4) [Desulfopila aestuarii DSM 18488]